MQTIKKILSSPVVREVIIAALLILAEHAKKSRGKRLRSGD